MLRFAAWPTPSTMNSTEPNGDCRLLPSHLSRLLSEPSARQAVVEGGDAAGVLREAFAATEAELTMEDEVRHEGY